MPARKPYKVDIDVIPYLSIMAIVLKLICLILIVMVMRIAINPDAIKVIRYTELYKPPEEVNTTTDINAGATKQISKAPVYFDCHPDHLEIEPEGLIVSTLDLKERGGDFATVIRRLETNSAKEFGIVIARPESAPVYRFVRRELASRHLTLGYDVLESTVVINWAAAQSNLQVKLTEIEQKKMQLKNMLQPKK